MSLPNFTHLTLARFQVCNREIRQGSTLLYPQTDSVYMSSPNFVAPKNSLLPITWVVPSAQIAVKTSAGIVEFQREFVQYTLVKPYGLNQDGENRMGIEAPFECFDAETALLDYYLGHPRLHTNGSPTADPPVAPLDDLGFLSGGIVIRRSEVTTVGKEPRYPEFWAVLVTYGCTFKYGISNSRA